MTLVDGNVGGGYNNVGRFYLRTDGGFVEVDVGDWVIKDVSSSLSVKSDKLFRLLFKGIEIAGPQ